MANYVSTDPNFGAEKYVSTDPNFGISEQAANLKDIWEGLNAPLVHEVPRPFPRPNPEDSVLAASAKGVANLPSDVLNFLQSPVGATTALVGGGLPKAIQTLVGAGFTTQQAIQALSAQTPQERAEALAGAALVGVGTAIHGLRGAEAPAEAPSAATERPVSVPEAAAAPETAPVAQNATAGRIAPEMARYQEPPTGGPHVEAANLTAGQAGGEPISLEEPVLPNSETAQSSKVREPLSLDELRLMRERNELQLQNDLARRATGATHPAIDERIAQINAELDELANVEAAPLKEAAPNEVLDMARRNDILPSQDEIAREMAKESPAESSIPPNAGAGVAQPATATNGAASRASAGTPVGVAERYAKAELGDDAVIPGEGVTWQESRDFGDQYLKEGGDPEAPIRLAQSSGRSGWQEVGIVSSKYEQLASARRSAYDALQQDPANLQLIENYNAAEKAQVDWRKEIQPVFTGASNALNAIRGERVINPGSFNDLVDAAIDKKGGRVPSDAENKALQGAADRYNASDKVATDAAEAVRQDTKRRAAGQSMTLDELRDAAEKFVKSKLADCNV